MHIGIITLGWASGQGRGHVELELVLPVSFDGGRSLPLRCRGPK